jgi:uncharacterized lipoprotein YddW (UPF0748 family)
MKKITRFAALVLMLCAAFSANISHAQDNPKREFRGAWLHVIGQTQYARMGTEEAKKYITSQIEKLHDAGCNAVIFQVRPCADALYISDYEPWSQYLTGKRGKAPSPLWDPIAFTIEQAHKLGMEFHAWLNPYRISTDAKEVLPDSHIAKKEPWRMFKYDNKQFFDPGIPENRDYIAEVVADIVSRYDVDAIHIDDYFYPYPAANGTKFMADDASYAKYGNGMERNDWRRSNVDKLIEKLHETIKYEKPWVRFGVSPFGIWRNKRTDPRGSESTGLQNYDDLYADVLLWAKNGWIDYIVPQLYWELDTKAAPSRKLVQWWNDNCYGVDLYIGQDTKRTMDKSDAQTGSRSELDTKIKLTRKLPNVSGNVWWHGYWVTDNYKGVADSLAQKYQSTIALPPAYGDKNLKPERPTNIKIEKKHGKQYISWDKPQEKAEPEATDAIRYVVYEFFPGEEVDTEDPQTIIALTPYNSVQLPEDELEKGTLFIVTALDRMNRESNPARVKIAK